MRRSYLALVMVAALIGAGWWQSSPGVANAQGACFFTLGFKLVRDQIPGIVGECRENEWFKPDDGNSLQQSTGGLLVWRKADNWTAFTDGTTTWINGPVGLASRPNSGPLFSWEAGGPPSQPSSPPPLAAPGPMPAPGPGPNPAPGPGSTGSVGGGVAVPPGAPVDCGPPSEDIPGPPARLIRVGQPMRESWLLCYVWRDIESQDYVPVRFGEARRTLFQGYPVECTNAEPASPGAGQATEGLLVPVFATNRGGEQRVLFTYRIQSDGDYINNCAQAIIQRAAAASGLLFPLAGRATLALKTDRRAGRFSASEDADAGRAGSQAAPPRADP